MSKPLLQRNTRVLLIWLPVVLLANSVLFYIVLGMHAHHMQKNQLLLKQLNVWNTFTSRSGNMERQIKGEYDIVDGFSGPAIKLDEPRDTLLYYADRKKTLPFQALTSRIQWKGHPYYITTYNSSTEISHLIIKVFVTEAVILLVLLIAIVILNRIGSRFLWRPFFATINAANNYDIRRNSKLSLSEQTGTTEFDELNTVLTKLITNANSAYFHQKQFVENASHEIQTPLAIIRSKLELLINQPALTERSALLLGDITEATDRLSQMNRSLLLLAKIENNQFPDTENVNVSGIIRETVNNFIDYYDSCPELNLEMQENVIVNANAALLEIFISNLINNAIVHNRIDGKINIVLRDFHLLIENTGESPSAPPDELFERFRKGSHKQKTTGLGLALVKQIGQLYHYAISYKYNDGWHRISVSFR